MAAEAAMGAPPPPPPSEPIPDSLLAVPMPPGSGTMLTGHVKSWIEDRGMGFISPDDGGDDAFVHRCQLIDGVCLLVGSPVVFEDNWDPQKNKRVAKKVSGAAPADAKGQGRGAAPELTMGVEAQQAQGAASVAMQVQGMPTTTIGHMLTGIVKTWKDERGMGFIAPANGGDDAFVHRSSLLDGQWLVVGSPVMFEDNWDHMKGKRIAKNVTGAVSAEGKGAGADVAACGGGGGGGKGQALMPVDTAGMQTGTVKAWYEDRGMGFIRPVAGGEDVFVHRSGLVGCQGLSVGMQVLYQEGWDPTKGKRMALKCVLAGQAGAAPAALAACPGELGGQQHAGNHLAAPPVVLGSAAAAPAAAVCTGVVKAWVDERGMGFIVPDGGGEDIFVHRSALVDGQWLMVGAHVSFEQGWDPTKNKNIARNVRGATPSSSPAAVPSGVAPDGMRMGTVKMWFVEKAFGFIIPDGGGDDVMVHKNEVADGHELQQGMPVKFDAVWDPAKGKYKASRCIPAYASDGSPANVALAAPGKGGFPPSDNLFIAGLPLGYSEDMIKQVFGQYGSVISCRVLSNPGKPDLACMVRMADANMAMWMVENLHGNIPVGLATPITVRFAQPVGYGKAVGKGLNQNRGSPYPAALPGQGGLLPGGMDGYMSAGPPGAAPGYQPGGLEAYPQGGYEAAGWSPEGCPPPPPVSDPGSFDPTLDPAFNPTVQAAVAPPSFPPPLPSSCYATEACAGSVPTAL